MNEKRGASRLRGVLPALLILAAASVFVGAHVGAYPEVSPFDEGVHFDYALKAAEGQIVERGERLSQAAMRLIACRGIDHEGIVLPPCEQREPFEPRQFPNLGFNSADIHSPVYYAVTGLGAKVVTALTPLDDVFTASRLVGILWLWLGLLTVWAICRELGLRTVPTAIVLLLLVSNTWILHSSATVNNDGSALLAGGAVVLATLRWARGVTPLWMLVALAFLAPLLKVTNAFAVLLSVLYLLLHRRSVEAGLPKRNAIVALMAGAGAAVVGWMLVRSVLASPVTTPLDSELGATGFDPGLLVVHLLAFVTPLTGPIPTAALGGLVFGTVANAVGLLIAVACFGPLLQGSFERRANAIAAAGALSMLGGGVLLFAANYLLFGTEFGIPPRYGLSLIPALAAALVAYLTWRWAIVVVGVFAVFAALLTLGALAFAY
jgi:hypothetical protein